MGVLLVDNSAEGHVGETQFGSIDLLTLQGLLLATLIKFPKLGLG